jgi:hypothetical protein
MTGRLLNRQVKLLEYLTSGGAIFGGQVGRLAPELAGIDRGLLDLEARFSHEKRMEKIAGVFPTTFAVLDRNVETLVPEFAKACPPHDISKFENARQFCGFIATCVEARTLGPSHLVDVAACELACAEARLRADAAARADDEPDETLRPASRRDRSVVLLRTAFDIYDVFADSNAVPDQRETCLAVVWLSGEPRITELMPEVFEVLAALDSWTALHDLPEAEQLATDLIRSGLLELRR